MTTSSAFAYVTLLTSESYLPGALVLGSSLRQTNTKHALVVLVTPEQINDSCIHALQGVFDKVVSVPALHTNSPDNLLLLGRPDLFATFTKLHLWNPAVLSYERIVFLDADTLVLHNVDHLFNYVADVSTVFAAAPDVGWPDCFNSGVFVTKPSVALYDSLVEYANTHTSFDGGDQGLLNTFFSTWSCESLTNPRTARLPFTFNVTPSAFYSYLPAFKHYAENISIVHFIGEAKPWKMLRFYDGSLMLSGEISDGVRKLMDSWWSVFDFHSLYITLYGFKLDRDWSQYQTPNYSGVGFDNVSSSSSVPHHTDGVFSIEPSLDTYCVSWDEKESRGALYRAKSSSRSPERGRFESLNFSQRNTSHPRSPEKKSPNTKHGHDHFNVQSAYYGKTHSPVKEHADSSSGYQRSVTIPTSEESTKVDVTELGSRAAIVVRTKGHEETLKNDFASYRVQWNPRELRGGKSHTSPRTKTPKATLSPGSELGDGPILYPSDDTFPIAGDVSSSELTTSSEAANVTMAQGTSGSNVQKQLQELQYDDEKTRDQHLVSSSVSSSSGHLETVSSYKMTSTTITKSTATTMTKNTAKSGSVSSVISLSASGSIVSGATDLSVPHLKDTPEDEPTNSVADLSDQKL
ncbi:hypothetical protein BASA60_009326 [Batrachochytrium salamandrivorans]|nr:hypothetical protein BASA60_009326 [Batrachochytrium salamandrivorans]KAH9272815.1 hypothetical protein BASA83_005022 [Batrachochytrium salamandrivorans]